MKSYFLRSAASRGSRRTVTFQKSRSAVSINKSKSSIQRPASQQQLGKNPSATGRRRPVKSSPIWDRFTESRTCKYFGSVMTLLLFIGAIVMVILYFHKQKKIRTDNAVTVIREFMLLYNKSFKGKSDLEILQGVQHLAQYLSQVQSTSDQIGKATNDIIAKLIEGWKPFSGNLYYFSQTTLSAQPAQKKCEQQGGHLVDITSRAEEEYLENEVAKRDGNFYIGLVKVGTAWQWVTGEPLKTSYWGKRQAGAGAGGPCAIIFKCTEKGKCWNDVGCANHRKWICKLKPNPHYL